MAVHRFWCHTKTFPLQCRFCGEQIYYFSCVHQSRVFFDELGWPWPIHRCGPAAPAADPGGGASYAGPSGWGAVIGVNIFVDKPGSIDLLPGLRRGTDSVDPALLKRVRGNGNPNREIMRLAPRGAQSVTAVGVVRELPGAPTWRSGMAWNAAALATGSWRGGWAMPTRRKSPFSWTSWTKTRRPSTIRGTPFCAAGSWPARGYARGRSSRYGWRRRKFGGWTGSG